MRFSDRELKIFKLAAGDQPLREWMRLTLIHSILGIAPAQNPKLTLLVSELLQAEDPAPLAGDDSPAPLP